MQPRRLIGRSFAFAVLIAIFTFSAYSQSTITTTNPIMFVTQVQMPSEWMTIGQTFGNHLGGLQNTGRGGDLYIRYSDGTLRNLTEEAGYGRSGPQGADGIAVRDPHIHWDGQKAVFSMVVGSASQQYQYNSYYWQLYEISGFGQNEQPVISKVANQPADYNNVSPVYGTDDRIIFTSDRPRNGQRHLHPQLDEYESAPTVTGMWSLDPLSGDLFMLNHSPSGSFRPYVDSFGRIVYTRWDHLQRDQQNSAGSANGAFNFDSEAPDATNTGSNDEIFPEPRLENTLTYGNRFELFFPWQINEDGTEEEIINHVGRHELSSYFEPSFKNDPNLEFFYGSGYNPNRMTHMFQIVEDPLNSGRFYGIDSPTFYHFAAGQIISLEGDVSMNPDSMMVNYITPDAFAAGHFRHPLPLTDGTMLASYTDYTGVVSNLGSREFPRSPFRFRLTTLKADGGYMIADQYLTNGIYKAVSYWDPDFLVTYADSLPMWELDPVEVFSRQRPQPRSVALESPEIQIFNDEGVDVAQLEQWMKQNDLALVISRDVTTRDQADRQQPYNLRVSGSATQTVGNTGQIYNIAHLQFFQGDQIRSYSNYPSNGRRILAKEMHEDKNMNIPNSAGPQGSVRIASDGSMAAFVPARRALTWQSTDDNGDAVVRERYWVTFQPGEIRLCAGCHGVNTMDQAGNPVVQNSPEALRELLQHYQTITGIDDREQHPATFTLEQNYPNPFNPSTTIAFTLQNTAGVTLEIFDVLGRRVNSLIETRNNASLQAGRHQYQWDGTDASGNQVASGVYFYQLQVRDLQSTSVSSLRRKMALLK